MSIQFLDFEQPIAELEAKIEELRLVNQGGEFDVGIEEEITFTGGVTKNVAMVKALEERLGTKVNISDDSHYMGALGAALFAMDRIMASRQPHEVAKVAE